LVAVGDAAVGGEGGGDEGGVGGDAEGFLGEFEIRGLGVGGGEDVRFGEIESESVRGRLVEGNRVSRRNGVGV